MKKSCLLKKILLSFLLIFSYVISSQSSLISFDVLAISEEEESLSFDEYKEVKLQMVNSYYHDSLSKACKELLNQIITRLNELDYDDNKSLKDNKLIIDSIVYNVEGKLNLQKNKDYFLSYKTISKIILDEEYLLEDDDANAKEIISQSIKEVDNLTYKEDETLDQNEIHVDEILLKASNKLETYRLNKLKKAKTQKTILIVSLVILSFLLAFIVLYILWRKMIISNQIFDTVFFRIDPILIKIANFFISLCLLVAKFFVYLGVFFKRLGIKIIGSFRILFDNIKYLFKRMFRKY